MSQVRELLVEELQDLLHAEGQLLNALPKMAKAAHNPTKHWWKSCRTCCTRKVSC